MITRKNVNVDELRPWILKSLAPAGAQGLGTKSDLRAEMIEFPM